jgi:hypothetical protein
MQLKGAGENAVKIEIAAILEKLIVGLDIELSEIKFSILLEDLIETYKHESIEDLIECFKNVRQGKCDWGYEKRGILNMVIIKSWMAQHLDRKAEEREKLHNHKKMELDNQLKGVDYEAYKERIKQEKEKKVDPTRKETEYQLYRLKWMEERGKAKEAKRKVDGDE